MGAQRQKAKNVSRKFHGRVALVTGASRGAGRAIAAVLGEHGGFGVHAGTVDGVACCRMFSHAIGGQLAMPKCLNSDHDPLFLFERWRANLRILEIDEIKTVAYVPLSHPFVERLIGSFVEDNKRTVLLRIPLCCVRSDNSATGMACAGLNTT